MVAGMPLFTVTVAPRSCLKGMATVGGNGMKEKGDAGAYIGRWGRVGRRKVVVGEEKGYVATQQGKHTVS